jgi:Flp pilus assembly protein TadD
MMGITALALAFVFILTDYSPHQFLIRMRDAFRYDLLPFFHMVRGIPYTVFSPLHLLTWFNLIIRFAPLGLFPLVILLTLHSKDLFHSKSEKIFLICITLCGLIFTFIINPALGMFRDSDMMSSFLVPMIFFTALVYHRVLADINRRYILVAIVAISVIHSAFYLSVNANEDRHLQRAEVLSNPLFLGEFAQKLLYDRLANTTWDRKQYEKSRYWYERYVELDSTNPRIIANLSDVYGKLNDTENEVRLLERSVELGSKNPSVYSNLGVKYYSKKKIPEAISLFRKALEYDSLHPVSNANIGLCLTKIGNYAEAIRHLQKGYNLGVRDPKIISLIGDNYLVLKNTQKAIEYYELYLKLNPRDTVVQNHLQQLKKWSGRNKNNM